MLEGGTESGEVAGRLGDRGRIGRVVGVIQRQLERQPGRQRAVGVVEIDRGADLVGQPLEVFLAVAVQAEEPTPPNQQPGDELGGEVLVSLLDSPQQPQETQGRTGPGLGGGQPQLLLEPVDDPVVLGDAQRRGQLQVAAESPIRVAVPEDVEQAGPLAVEIPRRAPCDGVGRPDPGGIECLVPGGERNRGLVSVAVQIHPPGGGDLIHLA